MLKTYVVSYDISDQKRWRRVYKKMRGFGDHVQYSVFVCELSEIDRVEMQQALDELIQHDEDQVLIVDIGPSEGRAPKCFSTLGKAFTYPERHAVVV